MAATAPTSNATDTKPLPPKGDHAGTITFVRYREDVPVVFNGVTDLKNELLIGISLDGQLEPETDREFMVFVNLKFKKVIKFKKSDGGIVATNMAKFFEELFEVQLPLDLDREDFDFDALKGIKGQAKVVHKQSANGKIYTNVKYFEPPKNDADLEFNKDRLQLIIKKPVLTI